MVAVIQRNRHISVAQRLPVLRTRENDILHGAAPQLFYSLFPQHPAHRIRHIALSRTVRTHNPRDPVVKIKYDLVRKGFKPLYLYAF